MNTAWQFLYFIALFGLFGCSYQSPYQRLLFVPEYREKILQTEGRFLAVYPYDYNKDGASDLILVGTNDIFCFTGTPDGIPTTPGFHRHFPEEIRCFDVVSLPDKDSGWLVVVTETAIAFFGNLKDAEGETIERFEGDIRFPAVGRWQLFENLDDDDVPDLIIPFCSRTGWYARLYFRKNFAFSYQGSVYLGGERHWPPPQTYLWQNREILVEGNGYLWIYEPIGDQVYPENPTTEIFLQDFLEEPGKEQQVVSLLGISELSRDSPPDMVIGIPDRGKMWVLMDRNCLQPLETQDILNLGVDFKDWNKDGWNDIICVMLKNTSWTEMFPYFAADYLPVTFNIYVFLNCEGKFCNACCRVLSRILWISLETPELSDVKCQILEDLNNDGLLDGLLLDSFGNLSYYYNICQFFPEQRPLDWFDCLLKRAYCELVSNHWPIRNPDFVMQLPIPKQYRAVTGRVLPVPGGNAEVVFHYRAFEGGHDLIVMVFPTGKVLGPG